MRKRALTESDRALWAHFVRHIAPMPGIAPVIIPETAPEPTPPPAIAPAPPPRRESHRPGAITVGESPGGIDRSTWSRFRGGKVAAMRTLDLHGRTVHRAYEALDRFLHQAAADGVRCVEVITGRGSGENGGAIRREFGHWLNQPHLRPLILGAAHPHAANPGSVRLLLRRPKAHGSRGSAPA